MERPRLVLPVPGGPTKHRITPSRSSRIWSVRLLLLPLLPTILLELAHRQVLEDPLLDILQIVVILVQHLAGMSDIQLVLGGDLPGHVGQPVEIGLDDRILGSLGWHLFHAAQLALGLFFRLLRHPGLDDLFAVLLDLEGLLILLAEFLLDGLELLPQEIIALHLFHLRLSFSLDLAPEFQDLQFLGKDVGQLEQLFADAVDLQDGLGIRQSPCGCWSR